MPFHRVERLRQKLCEEKLDALLISHPANRLYLSSFTGSAGYLLISQDKAILAVDFRYREQAKLQAPDFEVWEIEGGPSKWFPQLISGIGERRIGLESQSLTLLFYQKLVAAARKLPPKSRPQLVSVEGVVETLRAVKEEEEIAFIKEACALADAAEEQAKVWLREGISKRELAWKLEIFLREKGSASLPFEIIVASGPALPHAQPSNRAIQKGEPVIIDLGARVKGYCSNMTRTLFLGEPDETFSHIHNLVRRAQRLALESIYRGMSGNEIHNIVREFLSNAGYGEAFGHALGHGVGLELHEKPRLGPESKDILEEGMVFTIEPGIYLEGQGGVRVEDMILLKDGKPYVITGARV